MCNGDKFFVTKMDVSGEITMGVGVIIHGVIESTGFGGQKESKRVYRHNKSVINSLPDISDTWPFFSKRMFSVLPLRNSMDVHLPQYESLVISFGASYKNMYAPEAEWIIKFESLLKRLCWDRAIVYNDFAAYRYVWKVDSEEGHQNFFHDPPLPPRSWEFTCYKSNYSEVSPSEAIDGDIHYKRNQ